MLRWGIQHGRSVIPKSTKPNRIAENIDVFDFELTSNEMAAIDALDTADAEARSPTPSRSKRSGARSRKGRQSMLSRRAVAHAPGRSRGCGCVGSVSPR